MIAQVLFFNNFSEKDPHLNAVENDVKKCQNRVVDLAVFPPAGFKLTLKSRLTPGQRLRLALVNLQQHNLRLRSGLSFSLGL